MDRPALLESLIYLSKKGIHLPYELAVKTQEFYHYTLRRLVISVYNGHLGGEFIHIMRNLIRGQLTQAFIEGLKKAGLSYEDATEEWLQALDERIQSEWGSIEGLYRAIIDARILGLPLDPLLARLLLWVNRYNDIMNMALLLATQAGGKLVWLYGDTEHCDTCLKLHGKVAFASEWMQAGIFPQRPPNSKLRCGGWNCQCQLAPTERPRSPNISSFLSSL